MNANKTIGYLSNESLYHYGIIGQKWGVRRYQNSDGTLTSEGKARYGTEEHYNELFDPETIKTRTKQASIERGISRIEAGDTELKAIRRAALKGIAIAASVEVGRQLIGEGVLATAMSRKSSDLDNITELTNIAQKGISAIGMMGLALHVNNIAKAHREVTDIRNAKKKMKETESQLSHDLFHHGIKGQEWGVRNGPPYPIDDDNHSKKEKKLNWRKSLNNRFGLELTDEQVRIAKIGAVAIGAMYLEYKYDAISNLGRAGQDLLNLNPLGAVGEVVTNYSTGIKGEENPRLSSSLRHYLNNRQYHDNIDQKTGLYLKNSDDTPQTYQNIAKDLSHVNPDYRQGDEHTGMNCGLCSVAYEMRRRGYDVTAGIGKSGIVVGDYRKFFPGSKVVMRHGNGIGDIMRAAPPMTRSEAENIIHDFSREPGTRGVINLGWGGMSAGHAINYEVMKNGQVMLVCPQSNSIMYGEQAVKYLMECNTVYSIRTDNLKINANAMKKQRVIM